MHRIFLTISPKKKLQKEAYLRSNPAIAAIDAFKQRLHRLLIIKHQTKRECKQLLPLFLKMVNELKQSAFKHLQTLGKTLYQELEYYVVKASIPIIGKDPKTRVMTAIETDNWWVVQESNLRPID